MDAVGDGEGDLLGYLQRSAREGWVRLGGEQSGITCACASLCMFL